MDNETYHADRTAISKSGLDLINKSPAHYKYALDHPREETPAMQKGSLIHTMALEPQAVKERYAVMPASIKQRRGKEYDAFLAEAGDRIVITAAQMEDATRIMDAIEANPTARQIIADATEVERSVFSEDFETGALCKCRPDIILGNRLYDLKTTRNANPRSFAASVRNYRYHVQAAFYLDVCQWADIDAQEFGFIAVDTEAMPYQCVVYHRLAPEALLQGREEYRANLRTYAECKASGDWPGYPESYSVIHLSGYAFDEEENALNEEMCA